MTRNLAKSFIVLTLMILNSLPVSALEGQRWVPIIDRLIASGVSQIGQLDLRHFRSVGLRVPWSSIRGTPQSVKSGARESAYFENGRAHLSRDLPASGTAFLPALELHEVFRAVRGYNDENLELSTILVSLSEMPASAERDRLVQTYGVRYFRGGRVRLAEGGTSVSGGGDLNAVSLKLKVQSAILSQGIARQNFMMVYPLVRFEPVQSNSVHLKYGYSAQGRSTITGSSLTVLFPRDRAHAGDPLLVSEIAQKIIEIIPGASHGATRLVQPADCAGGGKTISFPATNDPDVRAIQDILGGNILKCQSLFANDPGFRGRETITGPLPEEPKRAGNYTFRCRISSGGGSDTRVVTTQHGRSQMSSFSIGTGDGSFGMAFLRVSAQGEIQNLAIVHMPSGTRDLQRYTGQVSSGSQASVQASWQGLSTSITCQRDW